MEKIKEQKETSVSVTRKPRKKIYERVRESAIPEDLVEHFKKDNYDLKLVRYMLHGNEDYRYLYRREREGYEFVQASEIPAKFMNGLAVLDTKSHQGLVTVGDLCLMKIDSDLRNSRRKYFQDETEKHISAVDIHVLEKKGFRNLGTRTKILTREPTFGE